MKYKHNEPKGLLRVYNNYEVIISKKLCLSITYCHIASHRVLCYIRFMQTKLKILNNFETINPLSTLFDFVCKLITQCAWGVFGFKENICL